jgi:hypothetical protein
MIMMVMTMNMMRVSIVTTVFATNDRCVATMIVAMKDLVFPGE